MPYSDPPLISPGEFVDDADWNLLVNDIKFLAGVPACRVYDTAAQSIPNATATAVTFNSERYDTDLMHSTSSLTSRITFNTAGLYSIWAGSAWAVNGTGHRELHLRLNGSTLIAVANMMTVTVAATRPFLQIATTYKFAAADYVELLAYQSSGGALNLDASANFSPELAATWVGRG